VADCDIDHEDPVLDFYHQIRFEFSTIGQLESWFS
jgi:hypothetical protein